MRALVQPLIAAGVEELIFNLLPVAGPDFGNLVDQFFETAQSWRAQVLVYVDVARDNDCVRVLQTFRCDLRQLVEQPFVELDPVRDS